MEAFIQNRSWEILKRGMKCDYSDEKGRPLEKFP